MQNLFKKYDLYGKCIYEVRSAAELCILYNIFFLNENHNFCCTILLFKQYMLITIEE